MINSKLMIDELLEMNEDEKFYKAYYTAKQEHRLPEFLKTLDLGEIHSRKLIVPELDEESIPKKMLDDEYFSKTDKKSVYLSKHNRYTPIFEHTHIFFEIIYVLCGSCIHHLFHEDQILKQGDLCLVSPSVSHTISVMDDDSIIINILMRRSTIEDIFFNILRDKSVVSAFFTNSIYLQNYRSFLLFHTRHDMEIRDYILEMYMEQMVSDNFADRIVSSLLIIFFTKLVRKHQKQAEAPRFDEKKTEEIISYITENFSAISLSDLADHLGYSAPYCSSLIKKKTGYTFHKLVFKIKFTKAEAMLRSPNYSVASISEILGYENPENFMRAFKKEYGMTPTEFRNRG